MRSANDVAVVIAEKLGGSESHFARMMTAEGARSSACGHTHYVNASGLPNRAQVTTAADLGLLARHIAYDFPQYLPLLRHARASPSTATPGTRTTT